MHTLQVCLATAAGVCWALGVGAEGWMGPELRDFKIGDVVELSRLFFCFRVFFTLRAEQQD